MTVLTADRVAQLADERGCQLFPSTESPLYRELLEAGYPAVDEATPLGRLRGVLLQRHLDGSGWVLTWLGAEIQVPASMLAERPVPGVRATDGVTARRAWERVNVHGLTDNQVKVLLALDAAGEYGMIDHDHEQVNGLAQDTAGKRRLELQRKGLVVEVTGEWSQRRTPRGSNAQVHRITDAGRQALRADAAPSVAQLRARAAQRAAAS